jgi:hypothetical protein
MFGQDFNLDFIETQNGLKLSQQSAISLYNALKSIDSLQASLVFDSLKTSLTKSGEACSNMSKTLASIAELEKKIATAESKGRDNSDLQERLSLYKEIAEMQTQEASSYNFMN